MLEICTPKRKLVLEFRQEVLHILAVRGRDVERYEEISLHETPTAVLASRLEGFRGPRGTVILVIPRASVIERQFGLESDPDPARILIDKIRQSLPVSLDEISYGMRIHQEGKGSMGVFLATPLKPLGEILKILDQAGLDPDEIVSSDQTLFWLSSDRHAPSTLVVSLHHDRAEVLMIARGMVKATKVFQGSDPRLTEGISFLVLESGEKPEKILLCGDGSTELESEVTRTFSIPWERIPTPRGVPPDLYGAALIDHRPVISLLPREKKIEKREKERKRLARDTGILVSLLVLLISTGVGLHHRQEAVYIRQLQGELVKLRPELEEVEQMRSVLEVAAKHTQSNLCLLRLLREMSQSLPGEVVLDEFVWGEGKVRLRGASPAYSGVVGTTQALDRIDFLDAVHLEYARLRKKQSRDFFEFEVSADRRIDGPKKHESFLEEGSGPKGTSVKEKIRAYETRIAQARSLVENKKVYAEEFESLKESYPVFLSTSDQMNDWVREMISSLESNALKVNQLEPRGIEGRGNHKCMQVKVLFEGLLEGLITFLYRLAGHNNGVMAEWVLISRHKEAASLLVYEVRLSKLSL